jgi:polyhydroxyalkanoate synthase
MAGFREFEEQRAAAFERLGVAEAPMELTDPGSLARGLVGAVASTVRRPTHIVGVGARLTGRSARAAAAAAGRAVGMRTAGPATPDGRDRRFADPAYEENAFYFLLAQAELLAGQSLDELLDGARVTPAELEKARFAARFFVEALSPGHTVVGNPRAMRRAFDTNGKSAVKGLRNLVRDVVRNGGWPAQVDSSGFELGRNTAATPGRVVHRNGLIELIQYEPQTDQVHEVPLLFCPPWINKYYLLDLAPGRSLIEWAVRHGHTTFTISYRNPDGSMRDLGIEDYVHSALLEAIHVVREITSVPKVNTVSACVGGTVTAMAMAHGAQTGAPAVNAATMLNTHTDFTRTGTLGMFLDEKTVGAIERRMRTHGYLDAGDMARTFDMIRARDLIFGYAVAGWLMGEDPPSFDLLAWNADSTRMPARLHSQYLRGCYVENRFARGEMEIDGYKLDPGAVDVETYVVGAIDDHIVPWQSAHRTSTLLGGANRFVLSTSGHIAGIVNPPSPKARYWVNEGARPADPDEWLDGAELHVETWWEDWARWLGERAGDLRPPPSALGSEIHPPMEDAPGTYVRAR